MTSYSDHELFEASINSLTAPASKIYHIGTDLAVKACILNYQAVGGQLILPNTVLIGGDDVKHVNPKSERKYSKKQMFSAS
tara:strand:+ start:234 stop:476 length:243 start_codon:yes stop_codon:yes gene_type:complete